MSHFYCSKTGALKSHQNTDGWGLQHSALHSWWFVLSTSFSYLAPIFSQSMWTSRHTSHSAGSLNLTLCFHHFGPCLTHLGNSLALLPLFQQGRSCCQNRDSRKGGVSAVHLIFSTVLSKFTNNAIGAQNNFGCWRSVFDLGGIHQEWREHI